MRYEGFDLSLMFNLTKLDGLVNRKVGQRVRDCDGQTIKGTWGMSWRQKAMKGVEVCEKLGGVDKRTMIPRFLNRYLLNT